jgi:hypothetical protein
VRELAAQPDMSHVQTHQTSSARARRTYRVGCDFSDLEDRRKVRYYLAHPAERTRITRMLFGRSRGHGFIEHMRTSLDPLPTNRLGLLVSEFSGVQLGVGASLNKLSSRPLDGFGQRPAQRS